MMSITNRNKKEFLQIKKSTKKRGGGTFSLYNFPTLKRPFPNDSSKSIVETFKFKFYFRSYRFFSEQFKYVKYFKLNIVKKYKKLLFVGFGLLIMSHLYTCRHFKVI